MASTLFTELTIPAREGAGLTLRNRAFVSPMCQYYASRTGVPQPWHLVHYGAFATGGFGLVTVESTAVEARGRISDQDLGLWSDEQIEGHRTMAEFMRAHGAAAAVQLGHAGGKAATYPNLRDEPRGTLSEDRAWDVIAPGSEPIQPGLFTPQKMTTEDIQDVIQAFREAARRADQAGYDVLQIHGAHGYLIHEFFSPLTNQREDEYGQDRARFALDVAAAVAEVWPAHKPLGIRLSATDWVDEGVTIQDTIELAHRLLNETGITWFDISSGGIHPDPKVIPVGAGYQVPLAAAIRQALPAEQAVVSAVGLITEPAQAETIVASGQADAASIARAALRNPHWAAVAARSLRVRVENNPASDAYWLGMR